MKINCNVLKLFIYIYQRFFFKMTIMLLKKRMHPRNIYTTPPNYKELAVNYPEFRKYVKQELSGKVTIDYQDQNAVKELTRVLLKKDFGLEVDIFETRLIPRVPLCLNYILWIEDLLNCLKQESQVLGVDIGTGCVCIYSLLGARKGWKMLATEIDPESMKNAQKNVIQNKLESEISVQLVSKSSQLLIGVIDREQKYDFCMCNPPFYSVDEKPQNRTSRRPQLNCLSSDVPTEISTEGGEISFITKLIEESVLLKDQIKIYTTLVGKKFDFLQLKKKIQNIGPKSFAFTEFCQGKTTRWGLAWTFLDIDLKNNERHKVKKKSKPPLQFVLPEGKMESLDDVYEDTKKVLNNLKINFTKKSVDKGIMICFKAFENTWSHQRRKKRLKARSGENNSEEHTATGSSFVIDSGSGQPQLKKMKLDKESNSTSSLNYETSIVEGLIYVKNVDSTICFEMSWLLGNKECLHQIFQYFKNYWTGCTGSSLTD